MKRWTLPRLPDITRDAHFYGGLALAAVGGWQFSPALTCVVLGVVLAAVGYFTPRRRQEG